MVSLAVYMLIRPGAVDAVWNVYHNRSETYLEHRLREWFGVSTLPTRGIGGRELAFWRLFGMVSFFGISTLMRPWRAVRAVWSRT